MGTIVIMSFAALVVGTVAALQFWPRKKYVEVEEEETPPNNVIEMNPYRPIPRTPVKFLEENAAEDYRVHTARRRQLAKGSTPPPTASVPYTPQPTVNNVPAMFTDMPPTFPTYMSEPAPSPTADCSPSYDSSSSSCDSSSSSSCDSGGGGGGGGCD